MFIIIDSNNNIVSYAYDRIDAIGNKEYFERKGMTNLTMKRISKEEGRKIFRK